MPKTPAAKSPRPPAARRKLAVPPILLEGDVPSAPRPSGPGQRYALGTAEGELAGGQEADLPESYGTERLLVVARDPHWLYAHWDMTAEQLRRHNAASRDGHLVVRVFQNQPGGKPVIEQHVHPESRNWFLHVPRGGARYVAQLGYHNRGGHWVTLATSAATFTPPDVLSEDTSVRFETIPVDVPFRKLVELVKEAVAEHVPLLEAIQELRAEGHRELPQFDLPSFAEPSGERGAEPRVERVRFALPPRAVVPPWTPEQEEALAQVLNIDEVRRVWMGSLEITELIRRALEKEISSQAAAALARGEAPPEAAGVFSVSSPFGGPERRQGFWFNINAELIIYGATEADASVTIGGRRIQLRRDGTFSFRFALPDGTYELPVEATAADRSDARRAQLQFRRATEYRGDVQAHAQDAALKAPRAENVS